MVVRSFGRGRLPVCVVRMWSVLRFIASFLPSGLLRITESGPVAAGGVNPKWPHDAGSPHGAGGGDLDHLGPRVRRRQVRPRELLAAAAHRRALPDRVSSRDV